MMKQTTAYLKDLRSDMTYSLESEGELQISSRDVRRVEDSLKEITFEGQKMELLHDSLILLVRGSREGNLTDGAMAEQITTLLKEYRSTTWESE